jgi:hypothetical protein
MMSAVLAGLVVLIGLVVLGFAAVGVRTTYRQGRRRGPTTGYPTPEAQISEISRRAQTAMFEDVLRHLQERYWRDPGPRS